ncbi:CHASE2 domain-containing protein [Bacteroidota bacterium]
MKNFFHKDIIFSTLFIFLVMYLLKLLVFNIDFLNPIANALKDFEFNDIYYSRLQERNPAVIDTNIIIVNIGYDSRKEIAEKIDILSKFKPAVIGLDVTFESLKEAATDSILSLTISRTKNLILATYFDYSEDSDEFDTYITSDKLFRKSDNEGFINFTSSEVESTVRNFTPRISFQDEEYISFPAKIVNSYNPSAFENLIQRNRMTEKIDYKGNTESFIIFDTDQINPFNRKLKIVKDKIVLMGFAGPDLNTKVLEDIHFTPLNHKYSGRSFPDMYGIFIHANIIHTILAGNYVKKIPGWISLLLAFILTYLCMYLFISYYLKWVIWYQVIVRFLQLILSIFFVALSFFLYRIFHFQFDAVIIIVPILLSIDVMEIYEGIVLYFNKKFGYKTLFKLDK